MKKVTLFSGYIIEDNELYRDQEAMSKLNKLIQDREVYNVISQLNGSFRFTVESETHTWFGIDHFGGYSLFYKTIPNLKIISNPTHEAKLSDIQDNQLCTLLASGFCYGDNTIFKDVKECHPGVLYTYSKETQRLTTHEWFRIGSNQQIVRKKEELSDLLLSLVPNNFRKTHLALTGGVDSRLLLSLFRKRAVQLEVITYGTANNPDIKLAKDIAQASDLAHHLFYLDKLDLSPYFKAGGLKNFLVTGFLGRSLPFESDWLVSNMIKGATPWVTTGFTSSWLNSLNPDYQSVPDKETLVAKIIDLHCRQTLISSSKFKQIIQESVIESLSHFQLDNFESDYHRWNIENRQHKYIINTSNNYRVNDIEVFIPLFDKRLMTFLNDSSKEQRADKKLYIDAITSNIFIGNEAYLNKIPSTNPKFYNPTPQAKHSSSPWKIRLRNLDKHNLNRIIRTPNNQFYGIVQSVLMQSPNYLSLKIEDAFPNLKNVISTLYDLKLTNSANHLKWLQKKRVVQLDLLGIEIIGFLAEAYQDKLFDRS